MPKLNFREGVDHAKICGHIAARRVTVGSIRQWAAIPGARILIPVNPCHRVVLHWEVAARPIRYGDALRYLRLSWLRGGLLCGPRGRAH